MNLVTPSVMTRVQARELERQLVEALRHVGLIPAGRSSVSTDYGWIQWSVDYPSKPGHQRRYMPEAEKNYAVVVTTGESRHSKPPRKKKYHRELQPMLDQIIGTANFHRDMRVRGDEYKMALAQKDFDRGWCAYRRGIICKMIDGRFHALVRVGTEEVWQDKVRYASSHDTLVFKSDIGKVNRWVTVEMLQLLLDKGALLNPKDVKFNDE